MLGTVNFTAFLISGIVLNLTPGVDTMYILSRSLTSGRKVGIMSVLGISSGIIIHTFLAAFGLSAVLAKSAAAFNIVKMAGVLYLVYLGVIALWQKGNFALTSADPQATLSTVYLQGLVTNVLNPKVALFFLAFLPQFVNPQAGMGVIPFIFLGLTFVTTGTIWCLFLAFFSSYATKRLRNNAKVSLLMGKLSGVIYLALGLKLFLAKAQQN